MCPNSEEIFSKLFFFIEYYARYASYNIIQKKKTYVVLSLNIFEDVRYPISRILVNYGKTNYNNQLWSNNVGFIFINQLEIFTEYQICFAFETIRRKLSSCISQSEKFKTAEGGNCSCKKKIF